jgi:integrase
VISLFCRLAVLTGMRFGELAALRWDDVDLRGEPRTVDLVPQGKQLLEKWYPQTRGRGLVFESVTGGYLDGGAVLDTLYDAMKAARVRRVSERGGKRTFHSYRHTFARITG